MNQIEEFKLKKLSLLKAMIISVLIFQTPTQEILERYLETILAGLKS